MIGDAVKTYHELLTPTQAADSQDHLSRLTERMGLMFGDRPVCSVLRPRFLTPFQFQVLQDAVRDLSGAFEKAYDAAMADAEFRKQFRLTPVEEELLTIEPGFRHPSPTARLDSFFVSEHELKFTEFNTETPAGAAYHDVLTWMFGGLPVMQEFTRKFQVRPLPARPFVQHALLESYRQWAGSTSRKPRIAIVDWAEVPTYSEFRLFEFWFTQQGFDCRIVDPRHVEYDGETLRAGDYAFDLIYKRVLIAELLDRGGADHPIVRAIRDGKVCMVNTFRCKILFKKASFAVLSDERNAHLFDEDQRRAIESHIPWTRVVEERKTKFNHSEIDLIPYIAEHRERFVLKPNDDYGGHGIVLGWTVGADEWDAAVRRATELPYVVQEKANLPSEPFPSFEGGQLHVIDRMLDTDPFVTFGQTMDGCLTRISTEALLNVTAGGGSTVPTFVVEPR